MLCAQSCVCFVSKLLAWKPQALSLRNYWRSPSLSFSWCDTCTQSSIAFVTPGALQISGRVFAEEVEPCGVVPTELLLERYRLGTLPDLAKCGDPRLNPRLGCLSDPDPLCLPISFLLLIPTLFLPLPFPSSELSLPNSLVLHFSEEHAHPDLKLRGRSVLCPKDGCV